MVMVGQQGDMTGCNGTARTNELVIMGQWGDMIGGSGTER